MPDANEDDVFGVGDFEVVIPDVCTELFGLPEVVGVVLGRGAGDEAGYVGVDKSKVFFLDGPGYVFRCRVVLEWILL